MPTTSLGALNAETDPFPVDGDTWSFDISGTFTGTVQMQYRPAASGSWTVISLSPYGSAPAQYTAPTGVIFGVAPSVEPEGQVRAVMTAYTSGTAVVRLGRP